MKLLTLGLAAAALAAAAEKHEWVRPAAIVSGSLDPALAARWRQWSMGRQAEITRGDFQEQISTLGSQNGVDPAKAIAALSDAPVAAAVQRDFSHKETSASIEKAIRGK